MSDRQDDVLNAIDATLSGYTDSDPISYDAMRWSPREGEAETIEVEGGAKITYYNDGYMILDEHLYIEATGQLFPHPPPRRPVDRFSFTRAESSDSIPQAPPGFVMGANTSGSDSIPVHISPGEAMIPGPNGRLIHVRGAYAGEPMQVTEIDLDDIEEERT